MDKGKDLIFKTLRHEPHEGTPWVPYAGIHCGKLKGYTAEELLTNADKLYEALMEAHKEFLPDGLPVIFDLQVEAEILGCELLWASDTTPSVMSHPFAGSDNKVPCNCSIPNETSGRVPLILDVMKRLKASIGDSTALYGLICGPFTLAQHLRGGDIFMDMIMDPDYVKKLIEFSTKVAFKMAEMYIEAGMDVIAVVDPLISQISPDYVKEFVSENYTALFDFIRAKNTFSCFFVCGNVAKQVELMCEMKPDGISVDENVDLAKVKEITDRHNISLGGNIPLATTMLHGTPEDNIKCVQEIMKLDDGRNLIVSPGCDMPYDVPLENTIAVAKAVKGLL